MSVTSDRDQTSDGWVHMPRRGVAVQRSALGALARHRWRSRAPGLKGVMDCASLVRDAVRGNGAAVLPEQMDRMWRDLGQPKGWMNVRAHGRSQIIVPGVYVIHVYPESEAAQQRMLQIVGHQRACAALAPRISDTNSHSYREEFVEVQRFNDTAGAVGDAAAAVRNTAGHRDMDIDALLSSMLGRDPADVIISGAAERLRREHEGATLPVGLVHGDLLPRNFFRRKNGRLVAIDWEFSRETVASYDFWHAHLWEWINGGVSRAQWRQQFRAALTQYLPQEADRADLHDTVSCLSTFAFFNDATNGSGGPKREAVRQLLSGAERYRPA